MNFYVSKISRYSALSLILCALIYFTTGCIFQEIDQPSSAQPDEEIRISISVHDNLVPEPNAHKGVLAVLLPEDWEFIKCDYAFSLGAGSMEFSQEWTDSVKACYPAGEFGDNMKWIGLISDQGYAYNDPITIQLDLTLKTGMSQGCFNLGYLVTKATKGLICSGDPSWAPLSYPHSIGVPDTACDTTGFSVEPATEWSDLFYRRSGWTGSDATYSIPLDGYDAPGGPANQQSLFVFGDTFVGEVDENGNRYDAFFIKNSYAVLDGLSPDPENITFYWDQSSPNLPQSVFVPQIPANEPDDWFWPMDGINIDGMTYLYGLRLVSGGGSGAFNFKIVGVSLLSFQLNSNNEIIDYLEQDTPLFYADESDGSEIVFGQAVMPMTAASGNPGADGFIYVYGPKNTASGKQLVASRVLPEDIGNFQNYEFWNGESWTDDIASCAPITDRISQEFSIHPVEDGTFLLSFSVNFTSVAIRKGESPVGPFEFYRIIWNSPEAAGNPAVFIYNAKAHPHLSEPEKWLISYNVNSFDFSAFTDADIYRPRFIYYDEEGLSTEIVTRAAPQPMNFKLYANYPNPFNPSTTISYQLAESAYVKLTIYNARGQQIKQLVNKTQRPGHHSVSWDAKDESNLSVSSGLYLYQLSVDGLTRNRKMIIIR
ncbi:DUF4185 domain-containing protein [candidate division KSB1 bacterium]|nr:DUF4185 domain-containing protein [candidate division KSB1 bacterium]